MCRVPAIYLDRTARLRFNSLPPVSRRQDTADVERVVFQFVSIFSGIGSSLHREKAMLMFFVQSKFNNADEINKGVHHCRNAGIVFI
jgi:hypothetical protein